MMALLLRCATAHPPSLRRALLLPSAVTAGTGVGGSIGVLDALDVAADVARVRVRARARGGDGDGDGRGRGRGRGATDAAEWRVARVSWRALLALNQRHALPFDDRSGGAAEERGARGASTRSFSGRSGARSILRLEVFREDTWRIWIESSSSPRL